MSYLKFKNISKSFGQVSVLENIDFSVNSEDFIVLLGPSGCGKTTLLRLIAGLEKPSSGEILFDDSCEHDVAIYECV